MRRFFCPAPRPRRRRGNRLSRRLRLRTAAIVSAVAFLWFLLPSAQAAGPAAQPSVVTIRLFPTNGSAVKGRAVLRSYDALTTVDVLLVRGEAQYVVELRQGNCQSPVGNALLPLSDAVPGTPVITLIDITLQELLTKESMIVVLRPALDLEELYDPANVVACGQIAGARPGAIPPRTGTAARIPRATVPLSLIGAAGLASLAAGLLLRYRER